MAAGYGPWVHSIRTGAGAIQFPDETAAAAHPWMPTGRELVDDRLRTRLWRDADTNAWLDERLAALEAGRTTPFAVADALIARSGALLTGTGR